ncbi:MAG: SDR family oxidoreductase [Planctomycetota bacterium]|nr:SDR family oxidoreductase [Planctomycetota bacterium]
MTKKFQIGQTCTVPQQLPRDPKLLQPLIEVLKQNIAINEQQRFPRGTLLPDGRLDLCKQNIGPEGAQLIAQSLQLNTQVTSLMLGADQIGNVGAKAIADLVKDHKSIQTLYLGCNKIDEIGAKALIQSIEANRNITGFWIKRNPIGYEGAKALAELLASGQHSLETLDLVQTGMGLDGCREVINALTNDSPGNTLHRIYIGGNQLGPDLSPLLVQILDHSALTEIYSSSNQLGDEGAVPLAQALADNSRLRALGLASNGLGEAGFSALAKALLANKTLLYLDLGFAPNTELIGSVPNQLKGVAVDHLCEALKTNKALRYIELTQSIQESSDIDKLLDALESNHSLIQIKLSRSLTGAQKGRLKAILRRNRDSQSLGSDGLALPRHLKIIKSVYRTAKKKTGKDPIKVRIKKRIAGAPTTELPVTDEEIRECARVLKILGQHPDHFMTRHSDLRELRAEANRLIHSIMEETRGRRGHGSKGEDQRAQRKSHDKALIEKTGLRQKRKQQVTHNQAKALPEPEHHPKANHQNSEETLFTRRQCYVCKQGYRELHHFYDSMCRSCGDFNYAKRDQSADLKGRVALLTGGRIKIGFKMGLKLLRAGATLILTTRFPCDAAKRYQGETDFAEWKDRLHVHGLDLRHLPAVLQFTRSLSEDLESQKRGLNIIINNAAQTIRRPPAFYEHLMGVEQGGRGALAPDLQSLISPHNHHGQMTLQKALGESPGGEAFVPAILSSVPILESDRRQGSQEFPPGCFDAHGQQIDQRQENSWTQYLSDISPLEMLEVHSVNALAPFIIVRELLPLIRQCSFEDRYIVNVSAMEGKFEYLRKQANHPHTNMAKAALNMLTRTSAMELIREGIAMSSVDTGWITNEQPKHIADVMKDKYNFQPPLDEIDGAARVLDPIFFGRNTGQLLYGSFFKDYQATKHW